MAKPSRGPRAAQTAIVDSGLWKSAYPEMNLRNLSSTAPDTLSSPYTSGPMFLRRNANSDRRRRQRQILNTSVRVFTNSGCVDALGINISDHGMCLFAAAHLRLKSQIQVEFLPPQSREPVRLPAIVRHRALYLYGIEFLADSEQADSETDVAANAG